MNVLAAIKRLIGLGVDPGEIRRPSGVSRRDFLKVCGITAVSVSVPGGLWLPDNRVVTPKFSHDVDEIRLLNEALFEQLAGEDEAERAAIDAVNDFTRMKMREEGFYRRIMPPVAISNDELDRSIPTNPLPFPPASDEQIAEAMKNGYGPPMFGVNLIVTDKGNSRGTQKLPGRAGSDLGRTLGLAPALKVG